MTTETAPVVEQTTAPALPEVSTPEQDQENEDAFAAGFTESRGDTPETPAPKVETIPAKTPDAATESTAPTESKAPEKPATLFAGKTEAEIQELFAKVPGLEQRVVSEISKVYGKFGEIQRTLQSIKPGQPTLKFKGALKRISKEYPEIAQMLAEDLAEAFEIAAPVEQPTPSNPENSAPKTEDVDTRIKQAVSTAVDQVREQTEEKLLTVLHSDWKTLANEKEFDTFLKKLPGEIVPVTMKDGSVANYPKEAARYLESTDALVTAEGLTKYKTWKSQNVKSKQQNKERLEGAILPTGSNQPPPATLDDEAQFLEGFKEVRAGAS